MTLTAEIDRWSPPAATGIPALQAALDPDRVAPALFRALGGDDALAGLRVERVHFSYRRPTVIQYRVQPAGGAESETVLAELIGEDAAAHAQAESVRLSKERRAQLPKGSTGLIAADPETGLVFRPPGFDSRLPGLKLLHAPEQAATMVAIALGLPCAGTTATVRLRAHRLGKRAVLQADLDGTAGPRRVFLRLRPVAGRSGETAFDLHRELSTRLSHSNGVPVPVPLGYDASLGVGLFGALNGVPPMLANGPSGVCEVRECVRAIEAFHSIGEIEAPLYGVADELALLGDWVARVSDIQPELGRFARPGFEAVSAALAALPEIEPAPTHRDFHEGQILIDGTRAGLLDFDTVRMADPALDIGNFIAHLHLAGLCRGEDLGSLERTAAHGSKGVRGAFAAPRIEAWSRAALLRLGCIHAFTHRRAGVSRALIEAASA